MARPVDRSAQWDPAQSDVRWRLRLWSETDEKSDLQRRNSRATDAFTDRRVARSDRCCTSGIHQLGDLREQRAATTGEHAEDARSDYGCTQERPRVASGHRPVWPLWATDARRLQDERAHVLAVPLPREAHDRRRDL